MGLGEFLALLNENKPMSPNENSRECNNKASTGWEWLFLIPLAPFIITLLCVCWPLIVIGIGIIFCAHIDRNPNSQ